MRDFYRMERNQPITIAIASGKGGTGKTTVAVSFALSLPAASTCLVDCDVEAPNAHLFLEPVNEQVIPVKKMIPKVLFERCTFCGKCAEICQFHAITVLNKPILQQQNVFVYPDLCHSCGACLYVCPEHALEEVPQQIGLIRESRTPSGMHLLTGEMQVGTAMPTQVIRTVIKRAFSRQTQHSVIIFDAPPGNSCSVVETVKRADFVVLVTEPTPFGLHDLRLSVQLLEQMHKPAGVIINRDGIGDNAVEEFLAEKGLPLLLRIPFDQTIAEKLSNGIPLIRQSAEYQQSFIRLFQQIQLMITNTEERP